MCFKTERVLSCVKCCSEMKIRNEKRSLGWVTWRSLLPQLGHFAVVGMKPDLERMGGEELETVTRDTEK